MAADERRVSRVPVDADLDPAIRVAAGALRSGLVRVHPSFRFEESLSARLAAGAARLRVGLPVEEVAPSATSSARAAGVVAPFRRRSSAGVGATAIAAAALAAGAAAESGTVPAVKAEPGWQAAAFRHLPDMTARPSRPFIVGGVGVGVASAAISLGAVYVAWRYSHPASGMMGRAVRAAHGRTTHSSAGRRLLSSAGGRRPGVINGIRGVVS